MKVLWLTYYPLSNIKEIPVKFNKGQSHSAGWIVNHSNSLINYIKDINLNIISESTLISKSFKIYQNNILFYFLRSKSAIPFMNKGYPNFFPFNVFTKYFFNRIQISNLIKSIKPDIIHAHGTEGVYALIGNKKNTKKIISIQGIVNDIFSERNNAMYNLIKKFERTTIIKNEFFIAKSNYSADFVKNINKNAKIFLIENPVNEVFLKVNRNLKPDKKLLFIGTIIKEKGIEELIDLMKLMIDINLIIVGSGKKEYINELKQKIKSLNLNNIIWKGQLEYYDIAKIMENCIALILPSHSENSPNVIIESMCAGLPVVATRIGGIPELIKHGVNGFLFEKNNVNELCNLTRTLIDNVQLNLDMSYNAKKIGKDRFAAENIAKKTFNAYQNVIGINNNL